MTLSRAAHRASLVLLCLVVLACLAYVVSCLPGVRPTPGYSGVWEVGFFNLVSTGSATCVLLSALRRGPDRRPWLLLGLGLSCYAAGTLFFSLVLQPLPELPVPSVSDGLWLAFYPFAISAVVLLARAEHSRRRTVGLRTATPLDGVIAGLSLSGISAAFAFERITSGAAGSAAQVLTNMAYPVADLVLLALVSCVLVVLGRGAGPTWWLLGTGFVAFTAADTLFLLYLANEDYTPGSLIDATWAVAVVLVAVAAIAPARPVPPGSATRPLSTIVLPAVFGGSAGAVLVAGAFVHLSAVGIVLSGAAVVAMIARLIQALREAVHLTESRRQARTDELTGLPNRRWFYEQLDAARTAPDTAGHVLLLDLDQFKEVNDALGHSTGDTLLRQVADRLRNLLGSEAVARLGGDEFALLCSGDAAAAGVTAQRILTAIRDPYDVSLMVLHIDGSIGMAPLDPQDPGRSLTRADIAMYRAKRARAGIELYVEEAEPVGWDRVSRVEALRRGIAAGELELDYQPVVDVASGTTRALEALVRWRHPERGRISPDDFLPLAEQTGLMHDVTMAVLGTALNHAARLAREGVPVPIAVNLSASDLLDATLPDVIESGLRVRGLTTGALRIEITETLLVADRERSDPVLARLRGMGIAIAVDDYGTGYSSLAYLHDLPVSELKIDRIFIDRVLHDPRTATIVRSTIRLAHDLGLTVIGEGVETAEQLDWLDRAGADAVQGWHLARPMPPDASLEWVRSYRSTSQMVADPTTASPA